MWQTLKEAIDDAMHDPVELYDWLHTADEIVEAVGPVLAAAAAGGTGVVTEGLASMLEDAAAGVALPVTATVAGAAAALLAELAPLGLGYAEAATDIKKDRSASGYSRGAVLGAGKASAEVVKSRFFESVPEQNDSWPEAGVLAQHYYNAALALGYRHGYELDKEETAVFWKDLGRGEDLDAVLGMPIPTDGVSSANDYVDFYIAAAAQFRKLHIDAQTPVAGPAEN